MGYTVTDASLPLGVQLLAVLGILLAVGSMFGEVATVLAGGSKAGLGLVALAFSVVQIVVLLALLERRPWAWYAAVGLFAFGGILEFTRGSAVGGLLSLLIVGYLYVQKPLFQDERTETIS